MSDAVSTPAAPAPSSTPAKGGEPAKRAPNTPPAGSDTRAAARAKALAAISNQSVLRDHRAKKSGTAPTPPVPAHVAVTADGKPQRDPHTGKFLPRQAAPVAADATTNPPETTDTSAATDEGSAEQKPGAPVAAKDAKAKAPGVPPEVAKKLAETEKRATENERLLKQGATLAAAKIADLTDDAAHWKGLFERAERAVKRLTGRTVDGRFVEGPGFDRLDLDLAEQRLAHKKLQRQMSARTAVDTSAQVETQATAAKTRAAALIAKHPELDPKTNPLAEGFWRTQFAQWTDAGELPATLEHDAEAWAMVARGRQLAAMRAAQVPTAPAAAPDVERPASSLPHAQAGSVGGKQPVMAGRGYKQPHLSNKVIHLEMAKRRAQRAGS